MVSVVDDNGTTSTLTRLLNMESAIFEISFGMVVENN